MSVKISFEIPEKPWNFQLKARLKKNILIALRAKKTKLFS